jgi:hypothetical protein
VQGCFGKLALAVNFHPPSRQTSGGSSRIRSRARGKVSLDREPEEAMFRIIDPDLPPDVEANGAEFGRYEQ